MQLSLEASMAAPERSSQLLLPSRPDKRQFPGKDPQDVLPDLTRGDSAKKKRGEPTEATTMDEKQVEEVLQLLFGDNPEAWSFWEGWISWEG
eukprot:symbB.v1.2.003058.t1/scaffold161.1/size290820/9